MHAVLLPPAAAGGAGAAAAAAASVAPHPALADRFSVEELTVRESGEGEGNLAGWPSSVLVAVPFLTACQSIPTPIVGPLHAPLRRNWTQRGASASLTTARSCSSTFTVRPNTAHVLIAVHCRRQELFTYSSFPCTLFLTFVCLCLPAITSERLPAEHDPSKHHPRVCHSCAGPAITSGDEERAGERLRYKMRFYEVPGSQKKSGCERACEPSRSLPSVRVWIPSAPSQASFGTLAAAPPPAL